MANYMLHRLTKRSNLMMAEMLRTHIGFTPTSEELDGNNIESVVEKVPRDSETCKVLKHLDYYLYPRCNAT